MQRRGGGSRGSAHLEFLVVVLVVALPGALALAALGPLVVEALRANAAWLALPVP
jgi:hypothetical protein